MSMISLQGLFNRYCKFMEYDIIVIRDYYCSCNNPSSSSWVYNQVLDLQELTYKPIVISPTPINPLKNVLKKKFRLYDTPSKKLEIYKDTPVLRPPYLKIPKNKFVGFTLKNLSHCIENFDSFKCIKLIHAHFGQNGVASLKLKKKLNVPLITSFYGYDSGRLGELYKPFYQKLIIDGDLFLALSEDMKSDLLNLGFPEEKIQIHHLGVDLDNFPVSENSSDRFTILSVARLDEVKGIQFVIEALFEFLQKHPEVSKTIQYKIVGGGPFENNLKLMVGKLGLINNVTFINNLILPNSREIVRTEMMNCDLFALCSFISSNGGKEGTPVVLMEAQACGKPCIASFHAGIPEVVKDNVTGILTHEKAVGEIADAIEQLYFNEELRERFKINARKHIEIEFNHKIQMKKLGMIYRDLIKN